MVVEGKQRIKQPQQHLSQVQPCTVPSPEQADALRFSWATAAVRLDHEDAQKFPASCP